MKQFRLIGALLATTLVLAACGRSRQEGSSDLSARIPATSFPGSKIEINEHTPQTFFGGRGYSYTATLASEVGFDVVTLPIARVDILAAGQQYCDISQLEFSRFFTFEQTRPGARSYTLYFNCA